MTATLPPPSAAPVAAARPPSRHRTSGNPTATQDVRRTLLALLACGLGTVPLCELIIDTGWLLDVWLTMLLVIGPAALMRLRRPPSAGQIWVGLILLIPWLTFRYLREHAYGGLIPLRASWHDLGALMSDLHHTTSVQAAPVHSTIAIKLALCTLLALVAALVDLVAVVGRRGALGGIPLLVIFTVSGAVPRAPVSWWLFAVAAAGFLILLALDSSDDLHRWGHFVPRANAVRARTIVTGQRIGMIAIALAVIVPAFVPADSRNLIANLFHNGTSTGLGNGFGATGSSGIDPFVALKGQLDRKTPINLFDVTVEARTGVGLRAQVQPFYTRTNVLSQFTGDGWQPGPPGDLVDIDSTDFSSSPGVLYPATTSAFTAHVKVTGLSSNPPLFAVPSAEDGLSADTQWSPQDQLLVNGSIAPGDDYDLTVQQPAPSVEQLSAATGHDPSMDQWLELPPVDDYVKGLVNQLTAGDPTPYGKARAISDYFANPANGFRYSLATQSGDSGNDLVDFLKNRVGYCQQYAAAMGVMLRVAGVPTRVVLGYTHEVPDPDGTFTVSTNDAHSWVEAYFTDIGWVPFDPTPLAGIAGGSVNDLPWAPHPNAGQGESRDVPTPTARRGSNGPSAGSSSAQPGGTAGGDTGGAVFAALIATGILAVLVVLAATPWLVRERRRRRRIRRARHGDTDAVWAELSDTATDLGHVWSAARTPRQVAQWLAEPAGGAAVALREMAVTVERTRYAPQRGDVDGHRLVGALAQVRSGLRSRQPFGERVRSSLFPASLGWPILRVARGRRRH